MKIKSELTIYVIIRETHYELIASWIWCMFVLSYFQFDELGEWLSCHIVSLMNLVNVCLAIVSILYKLLIIKYTNIQLDN